MIFLQRACLAVFMLFVVHACIATIGLSEPPWWGGLLLGIICGIAASGLIKRNEP